MVKLKKHRCHGNLEIIKILNPSSMVTDGPLDNNSNVICMSVESSAFVAFGYIWQSMRRLEGEVFVDFHYRMPMYLWVWTESLHCGWD